MQDELLNHAQMNLCTPDENSVQNIIDSMPGHFPSVAIYEKQFLIGMVSFFFKYKLVNFRIEFDSSFFAPVPCNSQTWDIMHCGIFEKQIGKLCIAQF